MGARAEVYVLGSSYSADALPAGLDGTPAWHLGCSYPLLWHWNNPDNPCVASSTIWPVALAATPYDAISYQPVPMPHPSVTLQSDLDSVTAWMALQPLSTTVIHPTWPVPGLYM